MTGLVDAHGNILHEKRFYDEGADPKRLAPIMHGVRTFDTNDFKGLVKPSRYH